MFTDKEKSIIENLSDRFSYLNALRSKDDIGDTIVKTSAFFIDDDVLKKLYPNRFGRELNTSKLPKGITHRMINSIRKKLEKAIKKGFDYEDYEEHLTSVDIYVANATDQYVELHIVEPFSSFGFAAIIS